MEMKEGYVYHIKDSYFDIVKDKNLMINHEGNATRPNYFCMRINGDDFLWFIPMSSKIYKYKEIIKNKERKYGICDTIIIGNYRGREQAFLIQNMFPITKKYIDHIDTVQGKAIQVPSAVRKILVNKVKKIFKLKQQRY